MTDSSQIRVHHLHELSGDDYLKPEIALNKDLLQVLCVRCHNEVHDRFRQSKSVIVVYGPPLAGKRDLVRQLASPDDIIVCVDGIWEALCASHADCLLPNVMRVHREMLDMVETRYGQWRHAWIVGTYAGAFDRDSICRRLRAEPLFVPCDRDECLRRAQSIEDPIRRHAVEMAVDRWFREYSPPTIGKDNIVK